MASSAPGRAAPMAPELRRAALVGSTLALIRQHGTQVSTRQIAEAAGVAEGTIFRVFPNKDALICAAKEAAFDPVPILEAIADLVRPDRDQLSCEPEQVARLMRLVCFAGSHPRIADGVPLTPQEVVGLLLDGVRIHPVPAGSAAPTEGTSC